MNDSPQFKQPQPAETASVPAASSDKTKTTQPFASRLLWGLAVLALVAAVAAGVWWWQQKSLSRLSSQKNDLSAKVAALTSEKNKLAAENKALAQSANPPANTVYKANVGKFTLTLPSKYVVVHRQDNARTGLPWLQLLIGEKTADYNVIEAPDLGGVTIDARLMDRGENFRSAVDSDVSSAFGLPPSKKLIPTSLTIDGTAAEVYTDTAFAQPPKRVYFTKNGMLYILAIKDGDSQAKPKLDAVIAGFKFN